MLSDNFEENDATYAATYDDEKQKQFEIQCEQCQLFQNVLAHVDEQVKGQMDKVLTSQETRVLMIYTGGTIGMVNTEKGYTIKKGFLSQTIQANKYLCDSGYTYFNAKDDFMITPVSIYKKRIWFKLIEFNDIRDSSTYNTDDWVNIASIVEENYENYNAFVILHGTDTMAFTASALSFMFENLKKTVVLTGSQVPLSEMRNDAFENILGALTIAGHFTIPEVTIFFKDKLFRGNRATKIDTFDLMAFDSPNINPLGSFGFYFKLDWGAIRKADFQSQFTVHKNLSKKIGVIKIFPMIPADVLDSVLKSPNVEACIIEAYGAGNLPVNRPEIAEVLSKACKNGKIIVIISQCQRGTVNALYAVGRQVKQLGIMTGLDMTLECAIAKLSYLLGKGYSREELVVKIDQNLRGELTPLIPTHFDHSQDTFIKGIADVINKSTEHEALRHAVFPTIMCYAADFGYVNVLQEIKKHGAKLETGDYEGRTPLHVAARKGHCDVVQYLIKEGVSINSVDRDGKSPLYEAIICRRFEAAKFLVDAEAKVLVDPEDFCHDLFKIVTKGDLVTLQFFFFAGVKNFNQYVNVDKRNLGHIAVAERQIKIIEFLKEEASFNFNVKDRWDRTPLDEAMAAGDKEIISMLKDAI